MEDIFENFHDTYGYEVQRSLASEGEKVCSKYRVSDVIASMGRLSDAQLTNCANLGVRLIEVPLAYEAYVAVVHRDNTWVDSLTLEEIGATNKRWPHDPLTATWNQLRASWPSLPITVLGLDVGPSAVDARFVPTRSTRGLPIKVDKKAADLPRAIEADYGSLGFMPFSTYETLMAKVRESRIAAPVKVVGIVNARGDSIMPSRAAIQDGQYDTLSRPLLFYFNEERLLRKDVSLFATHAIESASQRTGEHDLVPIDMLTMDTAARKIRNKRGQP
jgi:phosphate transport system substrate-binding protein